MPCVVVAERNDPFAAYTKPPLKRTPDAERHRLIQFGTVPPKDTLGQRTDDGQAVCHSAPARGWASRRLLRYRGLVFAVRSWMNLIVKGAEGRRVFDWGSYALLRDNVQHFIEAGQPNGRFPELHGIESAVDAGSYFADASRLRGEILRAQSALRRVPLNAAAQTVRTRAIMTGTPASDLRASVDARSMGWELPVTASASDSIPTAAAAFIDAVLSVTAAAVDGDLVHFRRVGDATAFERRRDAAGGR